MSVLYIPLSLSSVSSPNCRSDSSSPLVSSLDGHSYNKYQFYILFLRFFSFNLLTGLRTSTYFSFSVCACYILSRFSGQDRAGFDLYHHSRTRLDLCNFYGPSVRISARYKTPNSPFSSRSLVETLTHAFISESSSSRNFDLQIPRKKSTSNH